MNYPLGDFVLRRPELEDVESLYQQKNDPQISAMLGGFPTGYSREEIREWIAFHQRQTDEILWIVAEAETDRCVGHLGFYQIDHRVRSAQFGIMLGDRAIWGKGLGKACVGFALDYAFNQLNLNRFEVQIVDSNERAVRLYRSFGFKDEGRLRQTYYRNGQYRDLLVMSLLRAEYQGAGS